MANTQQLIEKYLAQKYSNRATIKTYRYYLQQADEALGLIAIAEVEDGATRISQWIGKGHVPSTQGTYHSVLHGFYKWSEAEGIVSKNPMVRVPRPQAPEAAGRHIGITDHDMARALAAFDDPKERLWLLLARYAGCTPQEIAALTRDDFPVEGDEVRVHGGRRRERTLSLPPAAIEAYRQISEPVL